MARMRTGDDMLSEEWVIIRSDGEERPVLISTSVIEAADGRPHVLALMQDITERKRLEEEQRRYAERLEAEVAERTQEIRASEEKHRALFENVDHAIVTTDCSGLIQSCNRTTARIFGVSSEEILGRPVYQVF